MEDYIYVDKLFGDNYRALVICEFTHEIDILKQLIEICDEAVDKKKLINSGHMKELFMNLQNLSYLMRKLHTII